MTQLQLRSKSLGARRIGWVLGAIVLSGSFLAWLLLRGSSVPTSNATIASALTSSLVPVRLAGDVRNTNGPPIAAAQICAYGASAATQLDRQCVATDEQGAYRLSLHPGPYSVTASAAKHASRSSAVTLQEAQPAQLNFTLDEQAPTLAGIVSSASGERLSGARVTVLQKDDAIANVVTNEQGEFSASTPSGSFTVKAEAAGFGAAVVRTVAPTMDVRITLFPGNVVAGKVLLKLKDELRPMPNVRVLATSQPGRVVNKQRDAAVQTDAQGNFSFADLAAGVWQLSVDGPNVSGMLPDPVRVTLAKDIHDLTILVQPARKVKGRFVVGDGTEPCPAGYLQFAPAALERNATSSKGVSEKPIPIDSALAALIVTAPIDANGVFEVAALPYGEYVFGQLCYEHQFVSGPTSLTVGEKPVEELVFKFKDGAGVTVHVVDEAQQPIAQAAVALSLTSDAGMSPFQTMLSKQSGVTDASGQYRFGGLSVGSYRVTARYDAAINDDGKTSVSQSISLPAGAESEQLTLTLPSSGSIRIHAHDASGAPVSRMLFFALDGAAKRYEGAYSGDGKFTIGPLQRESYRVFGYDNKNPKIALNDGAPVMISGTATVELDFQYASADGQMQGRIVDHNGAPSPGTLVRAFSTTLDQDDELYSGIQVALQGAQELMTDREGHFRIEGLNPQGTYDLHVEEPDGLQVVRYGVVPGNFVEIALPAPSSIAGNVVDASGNPMPEFDVLVNGTGAQRSQTFKGTDGGFTIDNIAPGDVQIFIFGKSGKLRAQHSDRLAEGQSLNLGTVALAANNNATQSIPSGEP